MPLVEIVVEDLNGAKIAAQAGAGSIELCVNLDQGGLTPPKELMQAVMAHVKETGSSMQCHCLILDEPSKFRVEAENLVALKRGIMDAAEAGVTGVVFGALTAGNKLDIPVLSELAAVAKGMQITHHRAFDRIIDQKAAIDELVELGFSRILTSGKPGCAGDHIEHIRELVVHADNRIAIVAGGGVRPANIEAILTGTKVPVIHMSARADTPDATGFKPTDPAKVRTVIGLVRGNG
ncbi:MAG: copper homeostasis protein CutC [Alphaproteobacteria bacterium]|nr:copper homeostasis protein CutC [Alphaproteobacteria bacterium]